MNCAQFLDCVSCVITCKWVVRHKLDPICAFNEYDTVGKMEFYIDIGGTCYPPTTTTPTPIIIVEGYSLSGLLSMLFVGLIIGAIILGVPMGIYLFRYRKNSPPPKARASSVSDLEDITSRQAFFARYYRRCRMDEIRGIFQLLKISREEAAPLVDQVNHEDARCPPTPTFVREPNRLLEVSIPIEDDDSVQLFYTEAGQVDHQFVDEIDQMAPRRRTQLEQLTDGHNVPILDRANRTARLNHPYGRRPRTS